jgi:nitrate reductase cytochrome c-type subunit
LQALQINLLELTVLQAKQNKTLEDSKIQPHKNHEPESQKRFPDNNLLSPNFVFLSPLLHHDLRHYAIITYQSQHNSIHESKIEKRNLS